MQINGAAGYAALPRWYFSTASFQKGALHRALIVTFVLQAAWKPVLYGGRVLRTGQLTVSMSRIAEELGVTRNRALRALYDLVADGLCLVRNLSFRCMLVTMLSERMAGEAADRASGKPGAERCGDGGCEAHGGEEERSGGCRPGNAAPQDGGSSEQACFDSCCGYSEECRQGTCALNGASLPEEWEGASYCTAPGFRREGGADSSDASGASYASGVPGSGRGAEEREASSGDAARESSSAHEGEESSSCGAASAALPGGAAEASGEAAESGEPAVRGCDAGQTAGGQPDGGDFPADPDGWEDSFGRRGQPAVCRRTADDALGGEPLIKETKTETEIKHTFRGRAHACGGAEARGTLREACRGMQAGAPEGRAASCRGRAEGAGVGRDSFSSGAEAKRRAAGGARISCAPVFDDGPDWDAWLPLGAGCSMSMKGDRAKAFMRFWEAFGLDRDRAEAALQWSRIPRLTPELADRIIAAAEHHARFERPAVTSRGRTPIYASTWLRKRRWEDAVVPSPSPSDSAWLSRTRHASSSSAAGRAGAGADAPGTAGAAATVSMGSAEAAAQGTAGRVEAFPAGAGEKCGACAGGTAPGKLPEACGGLGDEFLIEEIGAFQAFTEEDVMIGLPQAGSGAAEARKTEAALQAAEPEAQASGTPEPARSPMPEEKPSAHAEGAAERGAAHGAAAPEVAAAAVCGEPSFAADGKAESGASGSAGAPAEAFLEQTKPAGAPAEAFLEQTKPAGAPAEASLPQTKPAGESHKPEAALKARSARAAGPDGEKRARPAEAGCTAGPAAAGPAATRSAPADSGRASSEESAASGERKKCGARTARKSCGSAGGSSASASGRKRGTERAAEGASSAATLQAAAAAEEASAAAPAAGARMPSGDCSSSDRPSCDCPPADSQAVRKSAGKRGARRADAAPRAVNRLSGQGGPESSDARSRAEGPAPAKAPCSEGGAARTARRAR